MSNRTSKKFDFSKSKRLRTPKDFKDVFHKPIRSSSAYFSVLARRNDNRISRLGIIVAKKNIAKAVKRNTVRRIVRESFRIHQHDLIGLDIVVLAKASITKQKIGKEICLCLEKHWKELTSLI